MRSLSRGRILVVLLVLSVVTVAPAGALSLAAVDETQADFQAGTTTNGVTAFPDDTVGVDPTVGTTASSSLSSTTSQYDGPTAGVAFTPNQDLDAIYFESYDGASYFFSTDIVLKDAAGNELKRVGSSAQEYDSLFYNFQQGTKYRLEIDSPADSVRNSTSASPSFPYNSNDIDIVSGSNNGSDTNTLWNIQNITAVPTGYESGIYENDYTVTDAEEAFVNFSDYTVRSQDPGLVRLRVIDSSGTVYSDFVSSNKTVSLSGSGTETYTIRVAYDSEAVDTKLIDEIGVRFDSSRPRISNPDPAGDETVSNSPVGLSVDVSDADFATSQGDSVTVDFYDGDGTQLGSDTLSQNGTATANYSEPAGGANEWYAVATDSYGNTVTSQNFTFNAPAEIEIRSEQTGDLLTNVDVTLEFYEQSATNAIYSPPVTNGTADMTGLPADENFIAVAEADGYANRRIFIDSLIETQTVYLLNSSADAVAVEFELDDFSGQYQQDTSVLVVEREINGSYTPIQGDFFGAAGTFEATLVRDVRHRLRIRNLETGREAVIGTFTPQSSGPQTLTIEPDGDIQLTQQSERVSAQPALGVIGATDDAGFTVAIDEGDTTIQNYSVVVKHRPENGSTQTLATRSGSGAASEAFTFNLTDKDGIIAAEVTTTTSSGTTTTLITREIRASYPGANGLVGGLNDVGIGLNAGDGASGASSMTAFLVSVLVTAGVGSQSGSVEVSGLAALGSLSGFAILGWLSMQVLFASAVAFGAMLLLRRGV